MGRVRDRFSALPVDHILRGRVPAAEKDIQTGDIIAITSCGKSGYTSHVGMAVRQSDGVHLMHATSRRSVGRKVILDGKISEYLGRTFKSALSFIARSTCGE